MFVWAEFVKHRTADNPTYERSKTSSLHNLCALLQRTAPSPTVHEIAAEMNRIQIQDWRKYTRTKTYLLSVFPGLAAQVRKTLGSIVDFRTVQMAPQEGGFIKHMVGWSSSTRDVKDLGHIQTRECVRWQAPAASAKSFLMPEYQMKGVHYGIGNAATQPAASGMATDVHHPAGPFQTKAATEYHGGAPVEFTMDQTYESSDDGGRTWTTIPNSNFTITRWLESSGGKPKFTITKTRTGMGQPTATGSVQL